MRGLTPAGLDVIDAQVSPKGRYVSFVSKQNLYTVDLATGLNYQLTRDGKGPIHTPKPSSSRRKRWIVRPVTGGRPTIR